MLSRIPQKHGLSGQHLEETIKATHKRHFIRLAILSFLVETQPLYQQALLICEQVLGPEDPDLANVLESYASLLRNTKREAEAEGFEIRVKAIRAKTQD